MLQQCRKHSKKTRHVSTILGWLRLRHEFRLPGLVKQFAYTDLLNALLPKRQVLLRRQVFVFSLLSRNSIDSADHTAHLRSNNLFTSSRTATGAYDHQIRVPTSRIIISLIDRTYSRGNLNHH